MNVQNTIVLIEEAIHRRARQKEILERIIIHNGWDPTDPDCRWGYEDHTMCFWTIHEYNAKCSAIQDLEDLKNKYERMNEDDQYAEGR